jgi:hypothetical protein
MNRALAKSLIDLGVVAVGTVMPWFMLFGILTQKVGVAVTSVAICAGCALLLEKGLAVAMVFGVYMCFLVPIACKVGSLWLQMSKGLQ